MTMFPAENLSKQHNHLSQGFYGCCGSGYTESLGLTNRVHGYDYQSEASLGSDLGANPMAEDESRTNSLNEAGSSFKDNNNQLEERDEGWLQLSIGGRGRGRGQGHGRGHDYNKLDQGDPTVRREGLIELDLLPSGGGGGSLPERPLAPIFHMPEFRPPRPPAIAMHNFNTASSLFFQHQQGSNSAKASASASTFPYPHGEFSWAFRPISQNINPAPSYSSSSSSSSLLPLGSYFATPFQVQPGMDVAGPSSDVRIIHPPRTPHSGIWFMLQASQNQAKEPFLPQIPKSYLRIKDGKITVRLLMKYLVNKLRLDSESEIEITCRGQQLLPFLTLQHVRDEIWRSRDAVTLLPQTSTPMQTQTQTQTPNADHLMVLHYGRSA